jgi:hypothetical protein
LIGFIGEAVERAKWYSGAISVNLYTETSNVLNSLYREEIDNIFILLASYYSKDILNLKDSFYKNDFHKALLIEFLDVTVSKDIKRLIFPILEREFHYEITFSQFVNRVINDPTIERVLKLTLQYERETSEIEDVN